MLWITFAAMVIGIAAFFRDEQTTTADSVFLHHLLIAWTRQQPQDQFHLFTNKPDAFSLACPNLQVQAENGPGRTFFSRLGQTFRWHKAVKQKGLDAVLAFGRHSFLPASVPALLFLCEADGWERTGLRRLLKQARFVFVPFAETKQKLAERWGYPAGQIRVVYGAPMAETGTAGGETAVKERFTEGKEYYLYTGPCTDTEVLIRLLKAFSLFKKRQKTSFRLVLVNSGPEPAAKLREALQTYKYRSDVVLLEDVPSQNVLSLLSAAYAFVYPALYTAYGSFVLQAAQQGVPLIVPHLPRFQELLAEEALYFPPDSVPVLAEQLMRVYKDEHLRSQLARGAQSRAGAFSWQQAARLVGQKVRQTVK